MRRHIPESSRWLVTHGRGEEAEQIVSGIQADVKAQGKQLPHIDESVAIRAPFPYTNTSAVRSI